MSYALVQDRRAQGINGGASVANTWNQRQLNTVVVDEDSIVSLASNQITLQPGTYTVRAEAYGNYLYANQLRLRDITHNVDLALGLSTMTGSGQFSPSTLSGAFTLTGVSVVELQHMTKASPGYDFNFGLAAGISQEVYTNLELTK